MSLHGQFAKDLAMMMNPAEFGEDITFNDVPLIAIVDRESETPSYEDRSSVFVKAVTLHMPSAAVECPPVNYQVEFNSEDWVVGAIEESHELLIVKLWRDAA